MDIVDAQVHIWDSVAPGTDKPLPPRFGADDLLGQMDAAGVARTILVPASYDPAGNGTALRAAADHPTRFAVMGLFPIDRPDQRADLLDWMSIPGMVGLRMSFRQSHLAAHLGAGDDWFWADAERLDIPVMIYAPGAVSAIEDIAKRHPSLRIAIDHLALHPHARGEELARQGEDLLRLADQPNVTVKLSALRVYSGLPYPHRDIHALVCSTVAAFGAERCFWGSDLSRSIDGYAPAISMITDELPCLSDEEITLIMGQAITTWLDWDGTTSPVAVR